MDLLSRSRPPLLQPDALTLRLAGNAQNAPAYDNLRPPPGR